MYSDSSLAPRPAIRSLHGSPEFAPRVMLLTSGLGQGHTRVAQAIDAALIQRSASVETLDLWSLMNPVVVNILHQTYLRLVQEHSDLYERLYHLDEQTWRQVLESESGPPPAVLEVLELICRIASDAESPDVRSLRYSSDRLLLPLLFTALPYDGTSLGGVGVRARLALLKWTWLVLVKRIERAIDEYAPDILVCTQMIPAAMVSFLKQRHRLHVPAVGVVTDFGVHDFWIQPGIERYCVAHTSLVDAFDSDQRRADSIATGVPLMPGFANPMLQIDARRQLNLPMRDPIVLVLGGGLGLSVDSVSHQLLRPNGNLKLLVMPGKNAAAHEALEALSRAFPGRVRICEWTDRMDIYIRAADLVVGKPGGVTVAEVLACGRPLFATRSLGGQEGFNVRFLEEHGVGALVRDEELFDRVQHVVDNRALLEAMQLRAWALGDRGGAARVAEIVFDLSWLARSRPRATEH